MTRRYDGILTKLGGGKGRGNEGKKEVIAKWDCREPFSQRFWLRSNLLMARG